MSSLAFNELPANKDLHSVATALDTAVKNLEKQLTPIVRMQQAYRIRSDQ